MIDLHTHTNESDGSYTPAELIDAAVNAGLEALAITDHDTFAGHDQAAELAVARGLDLVCGIELNTRAERDYGGRPRRWDVHVLAYFLDEPPSSEFRDWLRGLLASRRERNQRLVARLHALGLNINLDEIEAIGRTLTGRPHFARVLVKKGYAANTEEAFRKYLGESAPGYVARESATTAEALRRIADAGGLSVVAHPIRLGFRDHAAEEQFLSELRDEGLRGLEAYHSDHSPEDAQRYAAMAKKLGLAVSGGSDFHGDVKPHVHLGTGVNGNLNVPRAVLDELRAAARSRENTVR